MELIFMRHGTTQGNLEGRFVGTQDMPLIEQGMDLARRVSPTLPPVEHLYRSPLLRCKQTAQLLWPEVETTVVDGLRETDFGPFEGKNAAELKDDPLFLQWVSASDFSKMPVGESPDAVASRAAVALRQVVEDATAQGFQRIGVVSHGGTIMGMLSQFGRPSRDFYGWMCHNCGGFRMELKLEPLELHVLEEFGGESTR